jgi:hypothetical protein
MYFTTRSKAKVLQSEFPIGDPFGGPAYGKREDIGSALSIGSSLIGSSMQSNAAEDAAAAGSAASKYSADLQKQMYDQTRADQTPWRDTGANALNRLSFLMGLPGSQKDRDALRAQYLPQYSTTVPGQQQTGLNAGLLASLQSQLAAATANYQQNGGAPPPQSLYDAIAEIQSGQGSYSDPKTTIDETGLNAAIDRSLSQQQTDPSFGSLSKSFGMEDFNADPGYQFRMDQGINALQGRAAAGGIAPGDPCP